MPRPIIYIAAGMLLLAVFPWPYGYFQLLRLVATVAFVWASLTTFQQGHPWSPWVFGVLALMFNPVFIVTFPREVWVVIDVAAGVFLLANLKRLTRASDVQPST